MYILHSIRFLKYLETDGAKTTYIASRELNSPSRVSKLENLAWKQEAEKVTKS
jgi:hypothetical protein